MKLTYDLPSTLQDDLDFLRDKIEEHQSGALSGDVFRSHRVPQGCYEQREDGTFMLRLRMPGGGLFSDQLRKTAEVARSYGVGRLHVTTRQALQVHDVKLEGIHPAMLELASAGLSTKGGGGNTVRNIMACQDAGVCPNEVFDVAPHAARLTEFMMQDPVSFQLPRKYKIAFSGCAKDCSAACANDAGFIAKQGPDGPGFSVWAGGGMGSHARVSQLLEAFIPVDDAPLVAEAIKRVFDKHGNRKNKHRARLRFLVKEKGFDAFRALYEEELAALRSAAPALPPQKEIELETQREPAPVEEPIDGFDAWRKQNVHPQKQEGRFFIDLFVPLGDLTSDEALKLADVIDQYGDGLLVATPAQNFVIRWVREEELPGLHRALSELGWATSASPIERDMIVCTGANTCRLGICLPPGLGQEVHRQLSEAKIDLDEASDLRLHINGCPNSCGHHPIASIGLFGKARRMGTHLVPSYGLQLGGQLGEGETRLAEGKDTLAARDIPTFLVEFLRTFRASAQYPDISAYLDADGRDAAKQLVAKYKEVPSFEADKNYYFDWGSNEVFSLAGRGAGECSAGVFDLIRVDLTSARDALTEGKLVQAAALASRAMLITQGEEAPTSIHAFDLFEKHFIDAGHIDAGFRALISQGRELFSKGEESGLDAARVEDLIKAVEHLYENMDQSLRFHSPATATTEAEGDAKAPEGAAAGQSNDLEGVDIDREADFQGVTCPLNYVKTKMLLGKMETGQVLSVLLDEAGGKSVPKSAEKDGHEVLLEKQVGDRWQVLLRKG